MGSHRLPLPCKIDNGSSTWFRCVVSIPEHHLKRKGNRTVQEVSRAKGRYAIVGSAMILFMAGASLAQNQSLPTVMESGSNDVISLQRGQIPDAATPIAPQSPSKALRRRSSATFSAEHPSAGQRAHIGKATSPTRMKRKMAKPSAKPDIASRIAPMSSGGGASIQNNAIAPPAASLVPPPVPESLSESPLASPVGSALAPRPVLDNGISERLVTVCLSNAATNSGTKAFDVQRRDSPRFVVGSGKTTCAKFEPTRQTIYFWKTNTLGKLALTLSNRLDLRDSEGTQIMLNWEQD